MIESLGIEAVLRQWTPASVTVEGFIAPGPAQRLADLLGTHPPVAGENLRPMWHEVHLREPAVHPEALGADGHPASSELIPPVSRRQRLFGGGRLRVVNPLRVGEHARRTVEIVSTRMVDAGSGPMLILTEHHVWESGGRVCLDEERDLVYRQIPEDSEQTVAVSSGAGPLDFEFMPTRERLASFSDLTVNQHRIHYDQRYAQRVEHHRDLLVHGPLSALLAAEAFYRHTRLVPTTFEFRLTAPAYVDDALQFSVTEAGDSGRRVCDVIGVSSGRVCIKARATAPT